MRRLTIYFFPFFLCGILIYNTVSLLLIGAVITALFLLIFIKQFKLFPIFSIVFLIFGMLAAHAHTVYYDQKYNTLLGQDTFRGYIIEKKETLLTVRNYTENYRVSLSLRKDIDAVPGDYIIFNGKVNAKPEFKKKILNSMGMDAYITGGAQKIEVIKNNNLLMLPVKLKYKLSCALVEINKTGGPFISGLVTGYTNGIDEDSKNQFQDLGISHVLAVSGFNIGIIYYFIFILTKKLNARLRYITALIFCFIYTMIGGFEPSLTRAFIMIAAAISAKLINRYYDAVSAITLAAFIMLTINSFYIYNIGFILSFVATYGILLLSADIGDSIPLWLNRLKDELSVGIAAFVSTFPFVIWYRGVFSLISLLVNVVISPVIVLATVLGFISSLLYLVSNLKILLYPVVLLGLLFVKLAQFINNFNILVYTGKPPVIFFIVYFLIIAIEFGYIRMKVTKKFKLILGGILSVSLIMILVFNSQNLKIHIINVGQGDSIFIETPGRRTILIDTGPKFAEYSAAKEKVIPYIHRAGYDRVDILILTHFHNDHAGDYDYVIKNLKVGRIFAFKTPSESNYNFTELFKGDEIKVGSLAIDVLAPVKKQEAYEDENEDCLLLKLCYRDFSMLLTGDAEKKEMDLVSGDYDILKVPHHGSINSLSEHLLNYSSIGTAIISVGKNSYGHPSPIVINKLLGKNIKVYRTDTQGSITIITGGEKYKIAFE